eukprot:jgi/Mesvir1/29460/Mv23036-RA.1
MAGVSVPPGSAAPKPPKKGSKVLRFMKKVKHEIDIFHDLDGSKRKKEKERSSRGGSWNWATPQPEDEYDMDDALRGNLPCMPHHDIMAKLESLKSLVPRTLQELVADVALTAADLSDGERMLHTPRLIPGALMAVELPLHTSMCAECLASAPDAVAEGMLDMEMVEHWVAWINATIATVARVVHAHGGDLIKFSGGRTITAIFPRCLEQEESAENCCLRAAACAKELQAALGEDASDKGKQAVALVGLSASLRNRLMAMLLRLDVKVMVADTLRDARDVCLNPSVGLALLDIRDRAESSDACAFVESLKSRRCATRFYAITEVTSKQVEDKCRKVGIEGCLSRPIMMSQLVEILDTTSLDRHRYWSFMIQHCCRRHHMEPTTLEPPPGSWMSPRAGSLTGVGMSGTFPSVATQLQQTQAQAQAAQQQQPHNPGGANGLSGSEVSVSLKRNWVKSVGPGGSQRGSGTGAGSNLASTLVKELPELPSLSVHVLLGYGEMWVMSVGGGRELPRGLPRSELLLLDALPHDVDMLQGVKAPTAGSPLAQIASAHVAAVSARKTCTTPRHVGIVVSPEMWQQVCSVYVGATMPGASTISLRHVADHAGARAAAAAVWVPSRSDAMEPLLERFASDRPANVRAYALLSPHVVGWVWDHVSAGLQPWLSEGRSGALLCVRLVSRAFLHALLPLTPWAAPRVGSAAGGEALVGAGVSVSVAGLSEFSTSSSSTGGGGGGSSSGHYHHHRAHETEGHHHGRGAAAGGPVTCARCSTGREMRKAAGGSLLAGLDAAVRVVQEELVEGKGCLLDVYGDEKGVVLVCGFGLRGLPRPAPDTCMPALVAALSVAARLEQMLKDVTSPAPSEPTTRTSTSLSSCGSGALPSFHNTNKPSAAAASDAPALSTSASLQNRGSGVAASSTGSGVGGGAAAAGGGGSVRGLNAGSVGDGRTRAFGVGVAYGPLLSAFIGSDERSWYSVYGGPLQRGLQLADVAARICPEEDAQGGAAVSIPGGVAADRPSDATMVGGVVITVSSGGAGGGPGHEGESAGNGPVPNRRGAAGTEASRAGGGEGQTRGGGPEEGLVWVDAATVAACGGIAASVAAAAGTGTAAAAALGQGVALGGGGDDSDGTEDSSQRRRAESISYGESGGTSLLPPLMMEADAAGACESVASEADSFLLTSFTIGRTDPSRATMGRRTTGGSEGGRVDRPGHGEGHGQGARGGDNGHDGSQDENGVGEQGGSRGGNAEGGLGDHVHEEGGAAGGSSSCGGDGVDSGVVDRIISDRINMRKLSGDILVGPSVAGPEATGAGGGATKTRLAPGSTAAATHPSRLVAPGAGSAVPVASGRAPAAAASKVDASGAGVGEVKPGGTAMPPFPNPRSLLLPPLKCRTLGGGAQGPLLADCESGGIGRGEPDPDPYAPVSGLQTPMFVEGHRVPVGPSPASVSGPSGGAGGAGPSRLGLPGARELDGSGAAGIAVAGGGGGLGSSLIGRDAEMGVLLDAVAAHKFGTAGQGEGRRHRGVAVEGGLGLGKSHLMREFRRRLARDAAACAAFGGGHSTGLGGHLGAFEGGGHASAMDWGGSGGAVAVGGPAGGSAAAGQKPGGAGGASPDASMGGPVGGRAAVTGTQGLQGRRDRDSHQQQQQGSRANPAGATPAGGEGEGGPQGSMSSSSAAAIGAVTDAGSARDGGAAPLGAAAGRRDPVGDGPADTKGGGAASASASAPLQASPSCLTSQSTGGGGGGGAPVYVAGDWDESCWGRHSLMECGLEPDFAAVLSNHFTPLSRKPAPWAAAAGTTPRTSASAGSSRVPGIGSGGGGGAGATGAVQGAGPHGHEVLSSLASSSWSAGGTSGGGMMLATGSVIVPAGIVEEEQHGAGVLTCPGREARPPAQGAGPGGSSQGASAHGSSRGGGISSEGTEDESSVHDLASGMSMSGDASGKRWAMFRRLLSGGRRGGSSRGGEGAVSTGNSGAASFSVGANTSMAGGPLRTLTMRGDRSGLEFLGVGGEVHPVEEDGQGKEVHKGRGHGDGSAVGGSTATNLFASFTKSRSMRASQSTGALQSSASYTHGPSGGATGGGGGGGGMLQARAGGGHHGVGGSMWTNMLGAGAMRRYMPSRWAKDEDGEVTRNVAEMGASGFELPHMDLVSLVLKEALLATFTDERLVIVLEDIHNFDFFSWEVLIYLLGSSRLRPLLVFTFRPDVYVAPMALELEALVATEAVSVCRLAPFSPAEATQMARRLVRASAIARGAGEKMEAAALERLLNTMWNSQLLEKVEGNPLYLKISLLGWCHEALSELAKASTPHTSHGPGAGTAAHASDPESNPAGASNAAGASASYGPSRGGGGAGGAGASGSMPYATLHGHADAFLRYLEHLDGVSGTALIGLKVCSVAKHSEMFDVTTVIDATRAHLSSVSPDAPLASAHATPGGYKDTKETRQVQFWLMSAGLRSLEELGLLVSFNYMPHRFSLGSTAGRAVLECSASTLLPAQLRAHHKSICRSLRMQRAFGWPVSSEDIAYHCVMACKGVEDVEEDAMHQAACFLLQTALEHGIKLPGLPVVTSLEERCRRRQMQEGSVDGSVPGMDHPLLQAVNATLARELESRWWFGEHNSAAGSMTNDEDGTAMSPTGSKVDGTEQQFLTVKSVISNLV